MKNYRKKRRQFIKQIALSTLGAASLPNSLFSLQSWAAAAADNSANATGDYKALVCLNLFGGNDGWNMLAPKGQDEYLEYSTSRGILALPQDDLLLINPIDNQNLTLGLHPKMGKMQQLFEQGKLSFLCNIGTKLDPNTTVANFQNQENLPLSLMSHNEQGAQWHTARVTERSGIGWAGKIADLLEDTNTNDNIPMNISLFGTPVFMRGETTTNFNLSQFGPKNFQYLGGSIGSFHELRSNAFQQMFDYNYDHAFDNNYNRIYRKGIETNSEFKAALDVFENSGGLTTTFSNNFLSNNLKMVAKSIAIGENLGLKRQIFFVHAPAFDNHKDLLTEHGENMEILSEALMEFQTAMEELGKDDCVVTFSTSDFGRTLTPNSSLGSDHAWGSNAFVMGGSSVDGGPVIGQSLYGTFPSLNLSSNGLMADTYRGIIIPTTSTDVYFAELAHWFGVSISDLNMVIPNIGTFMPTNDLPLGFLNI